MPRRKDVIQSNNSSLAVRRRVRAQVAGLCYRQRKDGKREVLLVTSRDTGRWVLPKGWHMKGKTAAQAARQEAWEEAGVTGAKVRDKPVGSYDYPKALEDGAVQPCRVQVYPMKVSGTTRDFPESDERDRKWVRPKRAAELVDEPELKDILKDF